ncbi:CDP-diacylglycerol--serine O-phosphatidyltransferase [Altererythrobacter epoxidivorans]|uniref:CDP-diacylglycerol--serine O-phosphatidyltransferase n=2 Tax=Altererythrobacter epoxidivorans TaxID=361183 RepID=A0A0M4MUH0_9SPHN|nr:CDP-diacylglycerol--serine O-phosphatidyltransferase [Altererythrobacter epoxidivorans]
MSHDPDLPRVGPKAAEDEIPVGKGTRGLTLRTMLPNAITAAALCSGLTGIRFAVSGEWHFAVIAIILAGVLDGIDGRIARLLKAQSRFGAELDSLADNVSFGVAPALILFMWSLQDFPRLGWFAALAFAVCMALRLARFNAQIDLDDQPHKSAGFLTGVPAPVGAGLAFLPVYFWLETGIAEFRNPFYLAIWVALIAFLLISNIATLSWSSIRPRRNIRLEFLALVGILFGGGLLLEPWWTLIVICLGYLALVPVGLVRYGRIRRQRREAASAQGGA